MGRALLLTGRPGVGKTTVIKKVADALNDQAGGFYTEEIRGDDGRRKGFRLVTLGGEEAVMAHVDMRSEGRPQVSRYGVDVDAIEAVGVEAIRDALVSNQVIIIDEIGKMELFCTPFAEAVTEAIEQDNPLLATVMRGSRSWVDELKAEEETEVWQVTIENRDDLPEQVLQWLHPGESAVED